MTLEEANTIVQQCKTIGGVFILRTGADFDYCIPMSFGDYVFYIYMTKIPQQVFCQLISTGAVVPIEDTNIDPELRFQVMLDAITPFSYWVPAQNNNSNNAQYGLSSKL